MTTTTPEPAAYTTPGVPLTINGVILFVHSDNAITTTCHGETTRA